MTTPTAVVPPPLPGNRPRGWWDRHWKWAVPVIAVVAIALFVASIFGLLVLGGRMMKSVEPYQRAVALARQEPRVAAALGAPIEEGWLPMGQISTQGGNGTANLDITLRGPRGKGHLYVDAQREGGQWQYRVLSFSGEGIQVDFPHDPPATDATHCEP